MAALDSDSDEDLVESYGTGLEPLEEGAGYIRRQGLWQTGWGSRVRGPKHSALCQTFSGTGKACVLLALGAATRKACTVLSRGAYISEGRIKGPEDGK